MSLITQTTPLSADLPIAGKKILALAESALISMMLLVPEAKQGDFNVALMLVLSEMRAKEKLHENMPRLIRASQIAKYVLALESLDVSPPIIEAFCVEHFQETLTAGESPIPKEELVKKYFHIDMICGILTKLVSTEHQHLVKEFIEVFPKILLEYSHSINQFLVDHRVGKAFAVREYLVKEHALRDTPLSEVPEEKLTAAKDAVTKMNKVSTGDLRIKSSSDSLKAVIRGAVVAAYPSQSYGLKGNAEEHLLNPEFVARMRSGSKIENAIMDAIGNLAQTISYLSQSAIDMLNHAEADKSFSRSTSISWANPAKAVENTRLQMLKALRSYLLLSMGGKLQSHVPFTPAIYPCLKDNLGIEAQEPYITLTMTCSKSEEKSPKCARYQFEVPLGLFKISLFLVGTGLTLTSEMFQTTIFEFKKEATELKDEKMLRLHKVIASELEGLQKTLQCLQSMFRVEVEPDANSVGAASTTLQSSRSASSISVSVEEESFNDDDLSFEEQLEIRAKFLLPTVRRKNYSLTEVELSGDLSPDHSPLEQAPPGHSRGLSLPPQPVVIPNEPRPSHQDDALARKLAICRKLAGPSAAAYTTQNASTYEKPAVKTAEAKPVLGEEAIQPAEVELEDSFDKSISPSKGKNPHFLFPPKGGVPPGVLPQSVSPKGGVPAQGASAQALLMQQLKLVLDVKKQKANVADPVTRPARK